MMTRNHPGGHSLSLATRGEDEQVIVLFGKFEELAASLENAGLSVIAQVNTVEAFAALTKSTAVNCLVLEDPSNGGWDSDRLSDCLADSPRTLDVMVLCRGTDPKETDRALSSSLGTLESCRWLGAFHSNEEVINALVAAKPSGTEVPPGTVSAVRSHYPTGDSCGQGTPSQELHPRYWLGNSGSKPHSLQGHTSQASIPHQMILVYSPKGGVGKTFIACNLGLALAQILPGRVALLDLDLGCADVCLHLDLLSGPTVIDLLPYCTELIPDIIKQHMVTHRSSGLEVLLGPTRPDMADLVRPENLGAILNGVRGLFEYTVVDMPPEGSTELTLECMKHASQLVLVTTQDTASLRHIKRVVESMKRSGIGRKEGTALVINRVEGTSSISPQQIEAFLGMQAAATIQENRKAVEESVFMGKPLVESAKHESISQSLVRLAQQLCPSPCQKPHSTQKTPRLTWPWRRRS